ncbi:MAG: type IX secretion system membrane protein PorP/SprF [Bacteroidales bacterium]|nr:type IX secretion system membrane protein PorP/SprF [Bacteroidales bacterium]MCF8387302.1 type IX secretion system membrane protein PorP/SprF [Bacteroidales bacterium]MCF8396722.1 type IX secretion system membrane protein PorP/SprF [Bacteroidales bacterium]
MYKVLIKLIITTTLLMGLGKSYAQDPNFSQFYANPVYLNPALTGATECGRIILNYRNQWPSISNAYVTYNASYDQVINGINSGVGLSFVGDVEGDGAINTNYISGYYSYKLKISESVMLSAGFQGTYVQQKLNWDQLVFGDQIDPGTGNISPISSETPPENLDKSFVDFSTGMVIGYLDKFFGGVAVHHLTEPNDGFYKETGSNLPMKITVHGGTNLNLSQGGTGEGFGEDLILSPNLLYQQQDKFHQLNVGAYVKKYPFVGGVWLRHNFENADAAIALIGITYNNYRIGYSYDFSLSKLSNRSGGAHEISFAWQFCVYKGENRRKIRAIKAPTF